MQQWCTEYERDGDKFGDRVYGRTWEEAQANADLLGLGTVIGKFIAEFDNENDAQIFWDSVGGNGLGPAD